MQKNNLYFVLFVLILIGLSVVVNLTTKPNLGLDVAGGVRFTIRAENIPPDKQKQWEETSRQIVNILERRAQQALGVIEGAVYRKGEDRFIVELPGFTDESEAAKTINTSARLEFYWPRNVATERDPLRPYEQIRVEGEDGTEQIRFKRRGRSDEEWLRPGTPEYKRMIEGWDLIVSGEQLRRATPELQGNAYDIKMEFDSKGAESLDQFARRVLNKREWLASMLDDQVVTFAYVMDGVTAFRGTAVLQGQFTATEANRIVSLLNAGALPVDLVNENVARVSPSIGRQALDQMLLGGLVAFIVLVVFMLVYYVFPGFVAVLALLAYTTFCYAVFKWIGVTFSLAAIAGFILSVGMAVDANILIFERLKEELRNGRTLLTAIDLGFKRALPAIIDSNACTIITCIVLMNIGTGPVKGFATTLMIGVIISLFTAVTVTRSFLQFFTGFGIGKDVKVYGMGRGWFGERLEASAAEKPLRIIERMKLYFAISGLIILPGVIFMFLGGIRPNVEFLGGVESVVLLPADSPTSSSALNEKLAAAGINGTNTKVEATDQGGRSRAYITIPLDPNPKFKELIESKKPDGTIKTPEELNADQIEARRLVVRSVGGDDTVVTEEMASRNNLPIGTIVDEQEFTTTGPAVREETIRGAIIGVIVSTILIILYLAIRFGVQLGSFVIGFRFGASTVAALVHDVLVVLGLAAITGYFLNWEISQLTITAVLTVVGFSVHDSIVIFDRIRENLRKPLPNETFTHLVDRSVTQSIARSINTSAVVIVTLGILVMIGSATPDLKHFLAAMLVGIASGTFSSIFNAAPILVLWDRIIVLRKGQKASIMHDQRLQEARAEVEDDEEESSRRRVLKKDDNGEDGTGGQYGTVRRRKR